MITHKINWNEFKTEVANREINPQWIDSNSSYHIYGKDGFICFYSEIVQLENSSVDQTDFETNYKDLWNRQLSFSDPTGIQQVIPSGRPPNTVTFFASDGDNGISLIFDMGAGDTSISKDLTFNEDIYIKDGSIYCENAPFGASFDVEVIHPVAGVVSKFCRNVLLFGTARFELNSEDKSLLLTGLTLRITLNNSQTNPAAFKAVGTLEGFRGNTLL